MNYNEWNNKIFEYFFNSSVANQEIIFYVDEDILYNIENSSKQEALKSFCNVVAEKIIDDKTRKIKLDNFEEFTHTDGIPNNTALLAFFILAASKMGSNDKITDKAYYPRLQELSKLGIEKEVEKGFAIQDKKMRNTYFYQFEKFEDYLNNTKNGELGFIHFLSLKEEHKNKDWVGRPIFQSMINQKDYALLTQYFKNNVFNLGQIIDNNKNKVKLFNDFSSAFKKIAKHQLYRDKLSKKILEFYKSWNGNLIEYNPKSRKSFKYTKDLLYSYKKDCWNDNEFHFYFTIDSKLLTSEKIEFDDYSFSLNKNDSYYSFNPIKMEKLSLDSKIFIDTDEYKIKRDKKDYILFKKMDELGYVESNDIRIGDRCSIISTLDFFKDKDERLKDMSKIDNYEERKHLIEDLYILENIEIKSYDDFFRIKSDEQNIMLKKGLKNNRCFQYVKEASPIIQIKIKEGHRNELIKIDNDDINYKEPIDIRPKYCSIGNHTVIYKNNNEQKNYEIIGKYTENESFYDFSILSDNICGYNINDQINQEELLKFIENINNTENITTNTFNYYKIIRILNIINILRKKHNEKILPIINKNWLLKNKDNYINQLKMYCKNSIERKYIKEIESEIN